MINGHIHSLETFGTVDGPGIPLRAFMQGCLLKCQYCHNPDTWALDGGKDDIRGGIAEIQPYLSIIVALAVDLPYRAENLPCRLTLSQKYSRK